MTDTVLPDYATPAQMNAMYAADPNGGGSGAPKPSSADSVLPLPQYDPQKSADVQKEIAGYAKDALTSTQKADTEAEKRAEKYQRDMDNAWNLEGYRADDPAMRPWNAEQKKAELVRGPIEQFGSIGVIFASVASAFTRHPMTSALNAGAAAMTAIQQGDEKAYESAFKAWKDNSELAIKRFDMERAMFDDINKLATTNMTLWKIKREAIAAQFNDQQTIALLENGMDPTVVKADAEKVGTYERFVESTQKVNEFNQSLNLFKQTVEAWKAAHPGVDDEHPTPEYVQMKMQAASDAKAAVKGGLSRPLSSDQEFIRDYYAQHPNATPEEFSAAFGEFKRGQHVLGGAAGGAKPGSNAADRNAEDTQIRKEHPEWSDAQVIEERNRRLKQSQTAPSGNKQVELQERAYKFTHSEEIIDRVEHELQAHAMSAGIAGKALRLEERLSNMVSAGAIKDSDRVQMMRDVNFLQLWGKELLTSKNDRLKSTGDRIDSIIAGLSAGDTTANTLRSLRELKKLYATMRSETEQELGRPVTAAPSAAPAPPPTSGKKPWANDAPSP